MKPSHLIYPVGMFALGTWAMLHDDWIKFGVIMWILGAVSSAWVIVVGMWAARAEHWEKLGELLHEVKSIDNDKLKSLGLLDEVTKIKTDQDTNTHYYELPARPIQIRILAAGVLSGVPFSRREWAVKRDVFSQGEFVKLQDYCRRNGLIEPEGNGYKLSDQFLIKLQEIASPALPHRQESL